MRDPRFRGRLGARVSGAVAMAALVAGCGQGSGAGGGDVPAAYGKPSPTVGDPSEPTPPVPTKNGLQSVWGSAEDDVWAVGDTGTIVHFDGHTWKAFASGVTENLTSVYGTGVSDAWASGDGGSVLHWDGASWKVASTIEDAIMLGVWTGAVNDVWAVGVDLDASPLGGAGFVRHWTGSEWIDSDVPGAETLWKVWGSGPTRRLAGRHRARHRPHLPG